VKIHIKEQPAVFDRFGVPWTPTLVVFDPQGRETYRFEGFLPAEDFLAQLKLGLARVALSSQDYTGAQHAFEDVVENHGKTAAAPEALYWSGVARYKTGDKGALKETASQFKERYHESEWAKKASVWG